MSIKVNMKDWAWPRIHRFFVRTKTKSYIWYVGIFEPPKLRFCCFSGSYALNSAFTLKCSNTEWRSSTWTRIKNVINGVIELCVGAWKKILVLAKVLQCFREGKEGSYHASISYTDHQNLNFFQHAKTL